LHNTSYLIECSDYRTTKLRLFVSSPEKNSDVVHTRPPLATSLNPRIGGHTLSGVHIREVPEPTARAFLSRLEAPVLEPVRFALGAFEGDDTLVGVLTVTGPTPASATIHVAVTPERRGLKISTDLVQTLAVDHRPAVGPHPRFCRALDPDTAERLRTHIDSRASRTGG
jgi:hypothetical protein